MCLPKSRGFLVRTFYRPPNSSSNYDKDFMLKLHDNLDIASAQGKEVLIRGDLNAVLLAKKYVIPKCKQLRPVSNVQFFMHRMQSKQEIIR